jgi:hypothetical protein
MTSGSIRFRKGPEEIIYEARQEGHVLDEEFGQLLEAEQPSSDLTVTELAKRFGDYKRNVLQNDAEFAPGPDGYSDYKYTVELDNGAWQITVIYTLGQDLEAEPVAAPIVELSDVEDAPSPWSIDGRSVSEAERDKSIKSGEGGLYGYNLDAFLND